METLVVKIGYREEEAAEWPEATPEERLNSTAMMLLLDNLEDANDIYHVHFTAINEESTITYRSSRPELITRLRHELDTIPELVITFATI